MFWILSFEEFFSWNLIVSTESRKQSTLRTYTLIEKFERILISQLKRVHVRFSPTIGACEIALIDDWRHLHAGMTLDAVERSLVTGTVPQKRFFGPMTGFDTTMFTNNVISLLLQFRFECRVHTHGDSSCSRIPLLMNGRERLG